MQACTRLTLLWLRRPFRSPAQVFRAHQKMANAELPKKASRRQQPAAFRKGHSWAEQRLIIQGSQLLHATGAPASELRFLPPEQLLTGLQVHGPIGQGAQGGVFDCTIGDSAAVQGFRCALKVSQNRNLLSTRRTKRRGANQQQREQSSSRVHNNHACPTGPHPQPAPAPCPTPHAFGGCRWRPSRRATSRSPTQATCP